MRIIPPPQSITEFQELYKKQYGIDLSYEEAEIKAKDLLVLTALSRGMEVDELDC